MCEGWEFSSKCFANLGSRHTDSGTGRKCRGSCSRCPTTRAIGAWSLRPERKRLSGQEGLRTVPRIWRWAHAGRSEYMRERRETEFVAAV
eukprot:14163510-Alexandrium_andersonii.AAC.1